MELFSYTTNTSKYDYTTTHNYNHRHTDTQTHTHTHTHTHTARERDRDRERQRQRETDRQTDRQSQRQTVRQTDRQACRQIHSWTYRSTLTAGNGQPVSEAYTVRRSALNTTTPDPMQVLRSLLQHCRYPVSAKNTPCQEGCRLNPDVIPQVPVTFSARHITS